MIINIIIISTILFVILLFGFIFISYKNNMKQAYANLDTLNSSVLETSFGDLEYINKGEGPPILVIHGIVGGCDHALQLGRGLAGKGFNLISVSRFGYLKSSLPKKNTPKDQTKAYKELLDYLNIDKVVVLAVSAGGASGIKFALEYPERTKGLILVGSGSPNKETAKKLTKLPYFVVNDFTLWFMLKYFKRIMLSKIFGVSKNTYRNTSLKERQNAEFLLETYLPFNPRKIGTINDEKITIPDMTKNYNKYDLEKMTMPTLIIHAKDDPLTSFESSKKMSERIPNSKFVEFKNGGHLVFGHVKEVKRAINKFIKMLE